MRRRAGGGGVGDGPELLESDALDVAVEQGDVRAVVVHRRAAMAVGRVVRVGVADPIAVGIIA